MNELVSSKNKSANNRRVLGPTKPQQTKQDGSSEIPASLQSKERTTASSSRGLIKRTTLVEGLKRTEPLFSGSGREFVKRHTTVYVKKDSKLDSQSTDEINADTQKGTDLANDNHRGSHIQESKLSPPPNLNEGFTPKSREILLKGLQAKKDLESDLKLYDV